jgi:hypothetical protein
MTHFEHAGCIQRLSFGSLQYCQCVTNERLCHVKCDFEPAGRVVNEAPPPLLQTPILVHGSTIKRSDLLSALMKDAAVHIYIKTYPNHAKHTLCDANEYTATRNTCLSPGM